MREPIAKGLPVNTFGQLEKIKYSDDSIERFVHDAEERLLVYIDPKGLQTQYEYDAAGLISLRIDPHNYKIKYQWDKLNRLKKLINENSASFEFFYDAIGRLIKEIDFDGKETIYEYDETNGQLKTSIEIAMDYGQNQKDRSAAKDRIQQFVMDSMGRLEQRTSGYGHNGQPLAEAQVEEFAYNSHGQILLAKNSDSKVEWFYDVVGNLVKEHIQDDQSNNTAVWKHSYDELDDRIKTIRPDGQSVSWLTYGTGHVYGLALNGEDIVSFERDDLHRETVRHYANGLSQFEHYDDSGRLSQQLIVSGHENGYASPLQQENNALKETQQLLARVYQYDKAGQLSHIQDTRRGDIHYKYDPLGRLLEARSKLGRETFSFDPAGNILDPYKNSDESIDQTQKIKANEYGFNHLVNNVVKEYLDQHYQYDAYGQLIRQKSTSNELKLTWDVLGRLIKSRNTQYSAEYRYDAIGRRLSKRSKYHHTGSEHHIVYGWDGDTLAYESNDAFTKHYIYEKDSFIPLIQAVYTEQIQLHATPVWDGNYRFSQDPLWKTTQPSKGFNELWFYHCDHLGTPQEMSDQTGQIIWKANYKAWGECQTEKSKSNIFENSEIITNNIRFQGQYFDKETGLHYNRHRYYSPYIGRYISKDPIGLLGGHNVYAYAPNPVEWIDPRGLAKGKGGKEKNNSATKNKRKQPCPKNVCEGKDPAAYATKWQGTDPYFGKDSYKNVVVKKGTVIYTLYPNGPNKQVTRNSGTYFVDGKELLKHKKNGNSQTFNDALQVRHSGNSLSTYPMRTKVIKFIVTADTCMGKGVAKKNELFGNGGGTQYVLDPIDQSNVKNTGFIADI